MYINDLLTIKVKRVIEIAYYIESEVKEILGSKAYNLNFAYPKNMKQVKPTCRKLLNDNYKIKWVVVVYYEGDFQHHEMTEEYKYIPHYNSDKKKYGTNDVLIQIF